MAEYMQFSQFPGRNEQRQAAAGDAKTMSVELRKYIQGQHILRCWLPPEDADRAFIPPKELYKVLSEIGFVWSKNSAYWRPSARRSAPLPFYSHRWFKSRTPAYYDDSQ